MFHNRFQESQPAPAANPIGAFVMIPVANAMEQKDFCFWTWMYVKAFQDARDVVIAQRRRESFAASLN